MKIQVTMNLSWIVWFDRHEKLFQGNSTPLAILRERGKRETKAFYECTKRNLVAQKGVSMVGNQY